MDGMGGSAPRVLIVDDDEGIRDALVDMLGAEGVDVVGLARNGSEAVDRAIDLQPDVVLMDLRMPELSGTDATEKIRAQLHNTQIIILSAYDDPMLSESAERAGAYAYLVKGCAAPLVIDVLREAAKLKRGLDERDGLA